MKLNNALLIQPLSAAKMGGRLSPDMVLSRYFGDIAEWVTAPTNDVTLMFTTGLYQNNATQDLRKQRLSLLQREAEWRKRAEKLLRQNSEQTINGFPLMREGFQMVSWDSNITENWNDFAVNIEKLCLAYKKDAAFKSMIDTEIRAINREPTEDNLAFLFEEISVTALWLKEKIPVSKGLRLHDKLDALHIVYPSPLPKFMAEGLKLLLNDKKYVLPLIWFNTADDTQTIPSTFRFGRDAPVRHRI